MVANTVPVSTSSTLPGVAAALPSNEHPHSTTFAADWVESNAT
jgi:hypothetical protein